MKRFILAVSIALLPFHVMADDVEGRIRKDNESFKPKFDDPVFTELKIENKGVALDKYQVFGVTFQDWNVDSLHWNIPSNFVINSDGSWFVYANHLANMRRTGGWLDTGNYMNTYVAATYFENYDAATKKCTGNALHAADYHLRGLDYKQEAWNVNNAGVDAAFIAIVGKAHCVSTTRWWR